MGYYCIFHIINLISLKVRYQIEYIMHKIRIFNQLRYLTKKVCHLFNSLNFTTINSYSNDIKLLARGLVDFCLYFIFNFASIDL